MRDATTAAGCRCRCMGALSDGGYGDPPAGSSRLHSMTLTAPGRGELRLRQLKLTKGHRMMTAPVSCRWLGCAAPQDLGFPRLGSASADVVSYPVLVINTPAVNVLK